MPVFGRFRPLGFALYAMDLLEGSLEVVDEQTRTARERATRERFENPV